MVVNLAIPRIARNIQIWKCQFDTCKHERCRPRPRAPVENKCIPHSRIYTLSLYVPSTTSWAATFQTKQAVNSTQQSLWNFRTCTQHEFLWLSLTLACDCAWRLPTLVWNESFAWHDRLSYTHPSRALLYSLLSAHDLRQTQSLLTLCWNLISRKKLAFPWRSDDGRGQMDRSYASGLQFRGDWNKFHSHQEGSYISN